MGVAAGDFTPLPGVVDGRSGRVNDFQRRGDRVAGADHAALAGRKTCCPWKSVHWSTLSRAIPLSLSFRVSHRGSVNPTPFGRHGLLRGPRGPDVGFASWQN